MTHVKALSYVILAQCNRLFADTLCHLGITSELFVLYALCHFGTALQYIAMGYSVTTVGEPLSIRKKNGIRSVSSDLQDFPFR